MTQFNFEGDVSGISDRQLEFINSVIQEHGFQNSKVTFEPVGKAGDNYASSVKRITIEGENGNSTMIVKTAPSNEVFRQIFSSDLLFKNEHIMYTEVLPKFVQLQKDAGFPEEEQLRYAKCYASSIEQPYEVILLEDLAPLDLTMMDRFQSLTNDCVKSVLKKFALLHACSYALKQKEPLIYDNLKENLKDMWAAQATTKEMKEFALGLEQEVLSLLKDPDHINLARHKIIECMILVPKFSKAENNSKYAVIIQGDAWTNNFMFKIADGEVTESILIDYQLSRSCSPVYDIMYMIFNCTDYETRKQHYYEWLDYYHSELEKALFIFNLKANFVYPRDKFDADLKLYGKIIFGLSIFLASILIRKSDDAAKVLESIQNEDNKDNTETFAVSNLDDESRTLFKNRVTGLLDSFVEFGLL